jgi:ring-1,2-phenylacetyl-CoA epoxidase subunit PaaD
METFNKHINTNKTAEEIKQQVLAILETVSDPEVPVLSVVDLGIVREIIILPPSQGGPVGVSSGLQILITPTYMGCPAIDVMNINMRMALLEAGFTNITIKQVLSPAWTTDWMSENGKEKLKAYGIAPPQYKQAVCTPDSFQQDEAIPCPMCNSYHTRLVSQFGSTACKALYQCNDCKEPFDYFKCH